MKLVNENVDEAIVPTLKEEPKEDILANIDIEEMLTNTLKVEISETIKTIKKKDIFPTEVLLECDCGAHILKLSKDEEQTYPMFFDVSYSSDFSLWKRIWIALKYIVKGKEFLLFDILLEEKEMLKLKEFVNTY